jgi:hypothetical protein
MSSLMKRLEGYVVSPVLVVAVSDDFGSCEDEDSVVVVVDACVEVEDGSLRVDS